MTFKLFPLLPIVLCFIQACSDKEVTQPAKPAAFIEPDKCDHTSGFLENGEIIRQWDCPDSRYFPPIDIKLWNKTPAVNGRLPTCPETNNGTAILHYDGKEKQEVWPYPVILPKLAYHYSPIVDNPMPNMPLSYKKDLVVVIQIVQTAKDTIAGYRYLTGGCGGDKFREFYFLTDEEVKKAVRQ